MPQDFEQMLKDVFGEGLSKVTQFQSEQMKKVMSKVQEIAREAMKEDVTRLTMEINELRSRVATLEAERVAKAADQV